MKREHQRLATSLVTTLQNANFTAFFAGGWVRDFVMGKPCQDIDIATNAHPEQVMKLFPRSVAVGAQFGVVRVLLDSHEFEVATFRSESQYVDGRRPAHVSLHSSPKEDALRRDFTINGMFYDPVREEIYDYVGGQEDIEKKIIRTIGEPKERFKEDRLRMIRAIRFKNALGFSIEQKTWKAICEECHHVASAVSPERVIQEMEKMFKKKILFSCLKDMASISLLTTIFPILRTAPHPSIQERLAHIETYEGSSLTAALCLLFQEKEASYLSSFVEEYHLSRKDKKIVELFEQYDGLHHPLSETAWVKLYARPEFSDFLAAVSTLRANPKQFLQRHQEKQGELSFWVDQVRTKKYLVTGEDLKAKGIVEGKQMGKLLEKAFEISVTERLQDKERIIRQLGL